MAQRIDEKAKQYMQQPEVFADIFNYYIYHGETKLRPYGLFLFVLCFVQFHYTANL